MKKTLFAVLLILVACQMVFATKVTYRWKYTGAETIDGFEVRLNGGEWQAVSAEKSSISYKMTDEEVAALTDTSFEIRSVIADRYSEIITIPSPVKAKITGASSENKHSVSFAGNPHALQYFGKTSEGTNNLVKSTYGTDGKIGYDMTLGKVFRVGADLEVQTFFFEGTKNYTDLSILAKLGYDSYLTDAVRFFTNIKGGIDLQFFESIRPSVVFEFGPEVGVALDLGKNLNIFASCEGLFGFPKSEDASFVEFRIARAIGMGFSF